MKNTLPYLFFFLWSVCAQAQCPDGYSSGPNLIKNSEFCMGDQQFDSDYTFTRESGGEALLQNGRYATVTNPKYAMGLYASCRDHSSNGGIMLVFNGSTSPNDDAWSQTIENLKPNTTYTFSFWTASLLKYSPAVLEVYINDNAVGSRLTLDSALCEWKKHSVVWDSKQNTQVKLSIRNTNTDCVAAHFALDDMFFAACEKSNLGHQLENAKVGQVFQLENIYFETAKYILKSESYEELDLLLEFLWNHPNAEIEVAGHTDNVGSQVNNQILSENRAQAVASYLEEKGIKQYRFTVKGYGEELPVEKNTTPEGRQKNRRVEFKIVKI
ncbi:OmpA family protein [Reichenbachiella agariperforans]|uniref:OmpA family protein n=1 Tax=Reichenbachiella agariperforans TaxID=156994 RepID=UPI001C09CF39|nr:OmpA family protein [Reichenbachiella agariperforans]MBU2916000.1 OmpA family protein [Reichenbachiella agariperforans]